MISFPLGACGRIIRKAAEPPTAEQPHAFMLITNSSEIFGKGFLRA